MSGSGTRGGAPAAAPALLEGRGLRRRYRVREGFTRTAVREALRGVDVSLREGEILGVVGESGSGKSTLLRLLVGLERPDGGEVRHRGRRVEGETAWRHLRDEVQVVFQDARGALDPRMRVGPAVGEGLRVRGTVRGAALEERVARVLARVGLPARIATRYPHELSGGERQRVGIARALLPRPRAILCDEPVSALDATIAAQILNLLLGLREEEGIAVLLVSHDLGLVHRVADRLLVFQEGRIVEEGVAQEVFASPHHPYTRRLLDAMLVLP